MDMYFKFTLYYWFCFALRVSPRICFPFFCSNSFQIATISSTRVIVYWPSFTKFTCSYMLLACMKWILLLFYDLERTTTILEPTGFS